MRPDDGVEQLSHAWNRWVNCYKQQPSGVYGDHKVPIRLRGYSEIVMSDLTDRERKSIDTSLRRGYTLVGNARWVACLKLLIATANFNMGYLGKTRGHIWMPTTESRDALIKHMEAQLVMTEKFSARSLSKFGTHMVRINVYSQKETPMAAHLTELRQVVDEHLELFAKDRNEFANMVIKPDAVIRLPFDSKKVIHE